MKLSTKQLLMLAGGLLIFMTATAQMQVLKWEPLPLPAEDDFPYTFQGAAYTQGPFELPVWFQEIPLASAADELTLTLKDPVYEPMEWKHSAQLPVVVAPRIEKTLVRKQAFARISILPIRMNPLTGKAERLLSFTLEKSIDPAIPLKNGNNLVFATGSRLASGKWYKIAVTTTGVHRISYEDLKSWGVDADAVNPDGISLHGFGGGMLPETNSQQTLDDLPPVSIEVVGGKDGSFDPGDHFLFYGESTHTWRINPLKIKLDHVTHIYSDTNYYFLTFGAENPARITVQNQTSLSPTHQVRSFMQPLLHEKESQLMTKSGKQWFGETFDEVASVDFNFSLTDREEGVPAILEVSVAGRSYDENAFQAVYNGETLFNISIAGIQPSLMTRVYARPGSTQVNFMPQSDNITLTLKHLKNNAYSIGYLDYIELNVPRKLRFTGPQLLFWNIPKPQQGNVPEFHLENAGPEVQVWVVTDPLAPRLMNTSRMAGTQVFKLQAPAGLAFVAFDGSGYLSPRFVGQVPNQNLHALQPADYLIITPSRFRNEAERLAQAHTAHSGLSTLVADVEEIYNEFSSGVKDPVAIRTFARMLYERAAPGQEPRYLLLFGDGSYDPKNRIPNNHDILPAFQSQESITIVSSYVTDDFYGLMDPNEGADGSGSIDIGIGRFPVVTDEQAKNMVDKVEQYLSGGSPMHQAWRNRICLVADDQDNNTHLDQAEKLALIIDTSSSILNVNKIYLDAYKQYNTSAGARYPDVNKAIDNEINSGALFMNYTGHGGELGWAGESILTIPEIYAWQNDGILPIFVTATCEFSRFDDPERISAGEHVILRNAGGGIALFTTTRIAYSHTNAFLNQSFYKILFDPENTETPRLGDLVRRSKNMSNNNDKIRNFALLGDPALHPAFPSNRILTTHINSIPVDQFTDTLKACQKVTIDGQVTDPSGNLLNDFNGTLYFTIFDKNRTLKTLGNDPESKVWSFKVRNKTIAAGTTHVNNGEFRFAFIIPKDIDLAYGTAKFSLYATDSLSDASGDYSQIILGGIDPLLANDTQGPEITLYLDDPRFASGNITTPNPLLIASLSDSAGINHAGYGLGHDINLWLDEDTRDAMNLNTWFRPANMLATAGNITYPLKNLPEGPHTLTLRAWDLQNNSSEKTISFFVSNSSEIALKQVLNRPNPFTERTWFFFEHNQPSNTLKVTIEIYNMQGNKVKTLTQTSATNGYGISPIEWDGRADNGSRLSSGIYPYLIRVENSTGKITLQKQKLVILR